MNPEGNEHPSSGDADPSAADGDHILSEHGPADQSDDTGVTITFYPKRAVSRSEPRRLTPSQALRLAEEGPRPPARDEVRRYTGSPGPGHPAPTPPPAPTPVREPSAGRRTAPDDQPEPRPVPPRPREGMWRRLVRRLFR